MTRIRRFLALPPVDRRLLMGTAATLAGARVALTFLPFGTVRRLMHRAGRLRANRSRDHSEDRIIWAVGAAGRRIPGTTCLAKALAAETLLAREGHRVQLRFGVARSADRGLRAHAWLESNGQVIFGGDDVEHFTVLGGPGAYQRAARQTDARP
jgi:hypothetical protein